MKFFSAILSAVIIVALVYLSFFCLMPNNGSDAATPSTEFSTERALVPLQTISSAQHYIGTEAHEGVRQFLVSEFEKMGLEVEIQEDFVLNNKSRSLDKPKNIIARIKGSGTGKSLLLLSHYDSALTPSYGASDAGSGIVTILESLRAYLAGGNKPINDIIILFTDAEEIGLDGAYLFVTEHRWAKNVGLALNFEARGSGGPSNMILETNGGNKNLINAFIEANPDFPVASSLMYSVYKMLPNDTDSTVLREEADVDGFFFAFIDDHFDYHTANDTVENLDINTLQHQGSYLLPLLKYFSNADLSQLKSAEDDVYVNFPLVKMISYPFSWILPMLIIAIIIFLFLIFYGFFKRKLDLKIVGKGFATFLGALLLCGSLGFFGWKLLLNIYPHYNEILHGFKYNGHSYVAFFVLFSISILFALYKNYGRRDQIASLLVAPVTFWLIINALVFWKLKGAAFFIIPVFFSLIALFLLIRQEKPNLFVMVFLAIPAIFLFSPLIQFFPVGLGSSMVVISSVFTVLLFGLLLPVFGFYKWKNTLAALCFLSAVGFLIKAHITSDFSENRQKPNSLNYFEDKDSNQSYWLTYDGILDSWTQNYLGENPEDATKFIKNFSTSKYNSGYTFAAPAPFKNLEHFEIILEKDSVGTANKYAAFTIFPKKNSNQIELYVPKNIEFKNLEFNGKQAEFSKRESNLLLRYYISDSDSLHINYSISKDIPVAFTVFESSFDLLKNRNFSIPKRPKSMMPKPFVVTDAVIAKRSFTPDTLQKKKRDSIFILSEILSTQ
ncbi:M28 family peptidase [Aequorivita echinoideorum]|uniref:Vacuolar membrane protease n=1 Tax=Aequorivita echinoideorum TaxID=1549647 RepID=A0ABS5S2L0_9FLAO|nr:M28 family peptidase [Aequorivita echinoideorum]MBT0607233.1 M28 family peptidase [Aequorivita echinoideorum]